MPRAPRELETPAPAAEPPVATAPPARQESQPGNEAPGATSVSAGSAANASPQAVSGPGCTAPQLRRFIKSRAWVPMHELRRRFGINGAEDDVTPVAVNGATIFVGLPSHEGQLLGELLRSGDIGYELSLDPFTPVVIGVYPMRPVPRH